MRTVGAKSLRSIVRGPTENSEASSLRKFPFLAQSCRVRLTTGLALWHQLERSDPPRIRLSRLSLPSLLEFRASLGLVPMDRLDAYVVPF